MNAIEIIKKSISMHPSLFLERLLDAQKSDMVYMSSREHIPAIKRSVQASANAYGRAAEYVQTEDADSFKGDIGAGVCALNVAGKLQCLPRHVLTSAAVETWPNP